MHTLTYEEWQAANAAHLAIEASHYERDFAWDPDTNQAYECTAAFDRQQARLYQAYVSTVSLPF